ncbi:hypothetical protein DFH07DRAFT_803809 [Mycena maculata]|uniref:Chromo domain-containing protein n=1 Tax=Mycena maculata TaxID=230809 RepID=A0AAD7JWJ3_9AGAR|nr:hypothetical protein DFH07DRAFT_803809 [Mycena maculata]
MQSSVNTNGSPPFPLSFTMSKRKQYYVEAILAAKRTTQKRLDPGSEPQELNVFAPIWEYKIKWAQYGDEHNSWEPVGNLYACKRLIGEFWDCVGEEAWLIEIEGFVIEAPEKWIKKQLIHFWQTTSLDEVIQQKKNPRKRGNTSSTTRTPISSTPLTPLQADSPRKSYRTKRQRTRESDSEDDVPIADLASTVKIHIPPGHARPARNSLVAD